MSAEEPSISAEFVAPLTAVGKISVPPFLRVCYTAATCFVGIGEWKISWWIFSSVSGRVGGRWGGVSHYESSK